MAFEVGQRFTQGCSKFPLAFTIAQVNPVRPLLTIRTVLGTKVVRESWLLSCLRAGCVRRINDGKNHANVAYKIGACKTAGPVVECSHAGDAHVDQRGPITANMEAAKMTETTNGNGVQTLTFNRNHKSYSSFRLGGTRGTIAISNVLFPNGEPPQTIEVAGLIPASEAEPKEAVDKAAERAAKAQAKAEAAQQKAQARAAKAQEVAEKARKKAEEALQRAQAKAAAATSAAAKTGEGEAQAEPAGM
jgi:hypothetical protein